MTKTLTKTVPLGKDSGKTFAVPLHEVIGAAAIEAILADEMATNILLVGVGRIFTDCQASAKTDAERLAACEKKLDAWRAGEFNVRGGGGETIEGEVKRLLLDAYMKGTGASEAKASAAMKGKGFEVLANIARQKALATVPAVADDATELTHANYQRDVDAKANELFAIAKEDWTARATASLAAKATAREAAKGFDLSSLV